MPARSRTAEPAPAAVAGNAAELTVSELSGALKRTVEDRFGYVKVRGEVLGWRGPHSSGHCYFSLKDEGAKIDAVMWKGVFARLRVRPEEGMEVIATGKVTTYPGKSSYQIVVESIEPAGVGALLAQLDERRKRLAAEGLFDEARKQLLPFLPGRIGVVTSPTGAVIRDILHRLADRFPVHVLVWPVRVQGETSAAEVAAAIAGFNALAEGERPDVIIVARGGGSLEDLWGFNDEIVVRAAAGSLIPLVSAVGHETDWTLIDHVADRRAPTPTAAAEICVPVRADLLTQTLALGARLSGARGRLLERRASDLRALARALPSAEDVLAAPRQRLDRASELLPVRLRTAFDARHVRLGKLGALLSKHSPQAELASRRARLDAAVRRHTNLAQTRTIVQPRLRELAVIDRSLRAAMRNRVASIAQRVETQRHRIDESGRKLHGAARNLLIRRSEKLASVAQLMASLGYRNVLARGFALVRDAADTPVRAAAAVEAGAMLSIEFADGRVAVVTAADEAGSRPPKASPSKPMLRETPGKPDRGQGTLF